MRFVIFIVIMVSLVQNGYTTPVEERGKAGYKYEEYLVEHEVSSVQARNSVLSTDPKSIKSPPGCRDCTPEDIAYCLGRDLINDHCCCDYKYHELLPYIPHTCYIGTQLCHTVLGSCDEYHRLQSCCCQKHAFLKWRTRSHAYSLREEFITVSSLLLSLIIYVLNN